IVFVAVAHYELSARQLSAASQRVDQQILSLRTQSRSPAARGFQQEGAVAGREEAIAELPKLRDLLDRAEHDARGFSGGCGLTRDRSQSVSITCVAVLSRDAERLSQVVGSDEENVQSRLRRDCRELREGADSFDLNDDQCVLVGVRDEAVEGNRSISIRAHA